MYITKNLGMTTIALYNIKGGVGKTAATVNLAYLAAETGKKVLVWDLDPQGAASFYFKSENRPKSSLKKVLSNKPELDTIIEETDFNNLFLVPAAFGNRHLDIQLDEIKHSKKQLKSLINELKGNFDYLFLDCPPGIGLLSEAIFNMADLVLMPTIPTTLSIRTYEMVQEFFLKHELNKEKLVCFFNMADIRKNLHNDVINNYFNQRDFLKSYIPYLSTVEKMGERLSPVIHFAPSSYAAQCFRALWLEIKENIA